MAGAGAIDPPGPSGPGGPQAAGQPRTRRNPVLSLLGFRLYIVALFLIGIILLLRTVLITNGRLFYTVDVAYLRLALAEMIERGSYGLSPGDWSAPVPSVLYPPLLAGGLMLGLGDSAAFWISALAGIWLFWLLARPAWQISAGANPARVLALTLAPCLVIGTNAMGLVMTGTEHLLHAALSVAAVIGLAGTRPRLRGRALLRARILGKLPPRAIPPRGVVPATVWIGLVGAPLIRFEGLALWLVGIAALAALGHGRQATVIGAIVAVVLTCWLVAMRALGLPVISGAALVHQPLLAVLFSDPAALPGAFASQIGGMLSQGPGMLVAGLALVSVFAALMAQPTQGEAAALWTIAAALALHLLFGASGWFWRYEAYAVALGLTGVLICLRALRRQDQLGPVAALVLAMLASLPPVVRFLPAVMMTPAGSESQRLQQYQMHRFATDFFRHPVAVDEAGWVSFRNERMVIDLSGAGSELVRRLRSDGLAEDRLMAMAMAHYGGTFAMLAGDGLGRAVPPGWCRMAVLSTPGIASSRSEVAFFLADPGLEPQMREALNRFRAGLPRRDRLDRFNCTGWAEKALKPPEEPVAEDGDRS